MARQMAARIRVVIDASTPPLAVEFAPRAAAVYLRLSDEPVVRTVEIEEGTLADYDESGSPVGFEILGLEDPGFLGALERLKARFSTEAPQLRSVEAVTA